MPLPLSMRLFPTSRTIAPSIVVLAGIASTSAWASSTPNLLHASAYRPISSSTTALRSHPSTMQPLTTRYDAHLPLARDAMRFIDASPDPFHVVKTASAALERVGFVEWNDDDDGGGTVALVPGGKYYFVRNKSTLVAFTVGAHYQPGAGFKIIGSHTDSPNLKVKPYSKRTTAADGGASGAIQLAVECYGGGLWHTWFDRDLGVSGRVFVREETGEGGETCRIRQELVKIDRAILRIPNLAIHLQTATEREAFKINKEDHLIPILATAVKESLGSNRTSEADPWSQRQEPLLVQLLAAELGVRDADIVDFELNLFDVQRAALGGVRSEFVHAARLDNLASVFLSLRGLIDHVEDGGVEKDADIAMVAMFDHEEVGSSSATGAGGPIVCEAVKRISYALDAGTANSPSLYDRAVQRSLVLSVDQAHAVHPNYAAKHEANHGPKMNAGMVIKRNGNQRYATNGVTGLIVRELARRAGLPPMQEFVVRNDCGCGSTIGPIISAVTGMRAIDLGCPQLSMHSIRETMGVADLTHGLALFRAFFSNFKEVDGSIEG